MISKINNFLIIFSSFDCNKVFQSLVDFTYIMFLCTWKVHRTILRGYVAVTYFISFIKTTPIFFSSHHYKTTREFLCIWLYAIVCWTWKWKLLSSKKRESHKKRVKNKNKKSESEIWSAGKLLDSHMVG